MPVQQRAFDPAKLSLAIYNSQVPRQRVDQIDLNPEITTITISTVLPGGYQTLMIGYDHFAVDGDGNERRFGQLPRYMFAPHFGIVHVMAGGVPIFEGRIVRNDLGLEGVLSFQAKGIGMTETSDLPYTSPQPAATDSTLLGSGAILQQVLLACCPTIVIDPDNWIEPGIQHLRSEFNNRFPSQIIDQITKEGNLAAQLVDFNVWGNVRGNTPYPKHVATLLPRTPPAVPKYRLSWDVDITQYTEISEGTYNNIAVSYTDAVTGAKDQITPYYNDSVFFDTYGFNRTFIVQGGTLSAIGASATARTYLNNHKTPAVQATLRRDSYRGLELAGGGQEQPPYLVKAGEWVQIANIPSAVTSTVMVPIVRTEFQMNTGELTVELGGFTPSWDSLIHDVHRAKCYVSSGSNINTGAPA